MQWGGEKNPCSLESLWFYGLGLGHLKVCTENVQ